ncbi:MAG: YkgJ family cysteine cluster protein [Spirochaetales bacterium]|nr:YkgJ family cysteine cluster protein [Spirochaetales bacterium]
MDTTSILPPSLLAERLESLAYLYHRADAAVAAFTEASGISCPFGCGSCCEGFVPDILPLEASYVAVYLAAADPGRAYSLVANGLEPRVYEDGRVGCPLYADDTPYHCTVYEARPLICRMFAFSAVRDKRGVPVFSACKLATSGSGVRSATGTELLDSFGVEPPLMADMGTELASIDPDSAGERKALPEALLEALSRVLFLVGMRDDDPLGGGPTIRPTMPRAG